MAYTTIDKPSDYFNTKLYAGNSSANTRYGLKLETKHTTINFLIQLEE
jgi:hypothetical protein